MASTMSRSERSLKRPISASMSYQRPVSFQMSAGCTTGMVISWPPMASISSRMMASILSKARRASGR